MKGTFLFPEMGNLFANVQGLVWKTGTEEKSGTWYTYTCLRIVIEEFDIKTLDIIVAPGWLSSIAWDRGHGCFLLSRCVQHGVQRRASVRQTPDLFLKTLTAVVDWDFNGSFQTVDTAWLVGRRNLVVRIQEKKPQ